MVTTDEMSDEDKEYLKKIEDYKLKRKEFLRQKELKNEVRLAFQCIQNLYIN